MPTRHATPRSRLGLLGVAALLLVVARAAPAPADEMPALRAADLELLPLDELERGELARDHAALAGRVAVLAQRAGKLRAHRARRADPDDDGGRRMARQAAEVEAELAPLLRRLVEACDHDAIDARLLAHLAATPEGPRRVLRHALGLVLFVRDLPAAQRSLFADLLPRVEGALLALDAQRVRLAAAARRSEVAPEARATLLDSIDAHARRIERRWWRLVDYVVPRAQRAALHRVLPTAYQRRESILQHLYALPGLTPSQGARLRAILEEVQAQAAPDTAALRRLQADTRDGAQGSDRRAAADASREAEDRLLALRRWATEEARGVLTPAQWEAYEAIPPRVSFQDRRATSVDLLAGVALSDAQRARLARMRAELGTVREEMRRRRLATARKGAAYGPDSPQMEGMRMEMASVAGEANVLQRRFNGRVLLELLTRDQVARWLLAPSATR